MPKNIIVCADGTGNKGGTTPDSNVFKIYKSINKHFKGLTHDDFNIDEQIIYYDNGVGTEKNKYYRMLGGALGIGFEDNVCDLYKFLSRNYVLGDRIYFFGFSRGASTVRACNGFISKCGLVKGQGLRNRELDMLVKEAFEAYKVHKREPEKANNFKNSEKSHSEVPIHFIGIWDTVVALGFPKRTDNTGPISVILNFIFWLAETILDKVWPHSFYYYRLTENVTYAYQALAIDDERTAFWPFVWQEKGRAPGSVEQVWFAGMHSNVGGGYARSGMASVPLHWMILRAERRGLMFNDDVVQMAFNDSHEHGRMYNSRDGFAAFYRYHPREIEMLCKGRINGNIKLHLSVLKRFNHRTANYTPGQIPGKFEVVGSNLDAPSKLRNPGSNPQWVKLRNEIDRLVLRRKGLYAAFLTFSLTIFCSAVWLWIYPPVSVDRENFWGHLADILDYFLFDLFDGLINVAVAQNYYLFIGAVTIGYVYLKIRKFYRDKTVDACERLRHLIIHEEVTNKD